MKENFKGKIVWITGASSGIGEALAYAFARQGARLILSARNSILLLKVKEGCNQPNDQVMVLPLDLSDAEQIAEKAAAAAGKWGGLDYLIHNAGQAARSKVEDTPMWLDRKIMEVNYFGTVALTKAVLPAMLQKNNGHLVVISSLSGKFGAPQLSSYAASKHALHGFFGSLRSEIKKTGIRISIIVPGFINTAIINHALDGKGQVMAKNLSVNEKGMSADECAERILKAINSRSHEIYIGGPEIAGVYFNRFFPKLFAAIISNHPVRRLKRALPLFFD
jgi:dehydrogenase/reductase SDR family protein 7B